MLIFQEKFTSDEDKYNQIFINIINQFINNAFERK